MVDKVQNAIDEGSNFTEAAAQAKLPVTTTPLITANGTSRADAAYKLPPELAPALKTGFDIAPNDPPEIVALPDEAGYAMVSPAQVVPAAPAPLASIRDQVASDWINDQATQRARRPRHADRRQGRARDVARRRDEGGRGHASRRSRPLAARRIQIADAQGKVPPALQILFSAAPGQEPDGRRPAGPRLLRRQGRTRSCRATRCLRRTLIGQMQSELQPGGPQDYAQQFVAAMRAEMKVKRNESAIAGAQGAGSRQQRQLSRAGLDPRCFVAYTFPVRSLLGK